MSRLSYAIARNRPDLPSPDGTARLALGGLAIIHGPAPSDASSPGLATLQGFASTVDALHARETVLPLRFGSLHDTEAGLETVLRAGLDQWRSLLDEVEGCDEMGLRVLLDNPEPTTPVDAGPTSPGLAYLAVRRAKLAANDALTAEAGRVESRVLLALEGLHRGLVVERPGPGRERLLSLAFLVPRSDLAAFREATRSLIDDGPGRMLSTGPWPPYHFASPAYPPGLGS